MLPLLTDLHAAGVASLTLDPVAGKLQIGMAGTLPPALRARVATHKAALLALCGDTPLTASPPDLVMLAGVPTDAPTGYDVDGYRLPDGRELWRLWNGDVIAATFDTQAACYDAWAVAAGVPVSTVYTAARAAGVPINPNRK